jgi:hypothetical protein
MLDCLTNGKWPIYRWISQTNLHSQKNKASHCYVWLQGGTSWFSMIISHYPILYPYSTAMSNKSLFKSHHQKKWVPIGSPHNFCGLRSSLPTCRRFPPGPGSSRGTRNGLCASVRHLGGVDLQKMMDIRIYTLCFFQHSHGKRHMNIDDKRDDLPI